MWVIVDFAVQYSVFCNSVSYSTVLYFIFFWGGVEQTMFTYYITFKRVVKFFCSVEFAADRLL